MRIKVRILLSPERVIRDETLEMELPPGATARQLLGRLPLTPSEKRKYFRDDGSGLKNGLGVLVDRINVDSLAQGLDTPLEDGNIVALIYLLTGG